jgi:hypothetical protein
MLNSRPAKNDLLSHAHRPEDVVKTVLFSLYQPAGCEVLEMVACASAESSWA